MMSDDESRCGNRYEGDLSYRPEQSLLIVKVNEDGLQGLPKSMFYGFLFFIQFFPKSESIGPLNFWVTLNPFLVPLATVVSFSIRRLCFFVSFLGRYFMPGVLFAILLLGGIIFVAHLLGLFGIGSLAISCCDECLGKFMITVFIISSLYDKVRFLFF